MGEGEGEVTMGVGRERERDEGSGGTEGSYDIVSLSNNRGLLMELTD